MARRGRTRTLPTRAVRPSWAAVLVALIMGAFVVTAAGPAAAHEERPAGFPDGTGARPAYLGLDNPRSRVVCTAQSAELIAAMSAGPLKRQNRALLQRCGYRSIQTAINSITQRNTSIYVLPGTYTERKWANLERSSYCSNLKTSSDSPLADVDYIGSVSDPESGSGSSDPIALSYSDQLKCPHNLNLITIFGDQTPDNGSMKCDSKFCGTQVVGTGPRRDSVVIDNKFSKLNAIRADRAGGVYFRNFTVQQAEFNALYIMETDGFVASRLIARGNDEYGILAFASDHGLIEHSEAYYNGDSGVYPGSASDINGDSTKFKPSRYSIVIRHNRSHHNTLGYSGTAGNSVLSYRNRFYKNATGIATDSLFPGHPGLPQDHARWTKNWVYSNNVNYYKRYVDTDICDKPMEDRGYMQGTVCPVVPVPVGTGVLIAGGNYNSTDDNWIYDNWRYGTMTFWVPGALRDEYDPAKQYDTSHFNRTFGNRMGLRPDGTKSHNGMDHWWDDEGEGNCWEGNTSSRGEPTHNFSPAVLGDPLSCPGGSQRTPGLFIKDAGFLTCAAYDRNDENFEHPQNCNWFDSPPRPTNTYQGDPMLPGQARQDAVTTTSNEDLTSALGLLAVLPLFGLGAAARGRLRTGMSRRSKAPARRRG